MVNIECARYFPAEGQPVSQPLHFDKRYVLPEHREKMLQAKFPHTRDASIVFYEEDHVYTHNSVPVEVSVSSVLPEEEFIPDKAISMMKNSRGEAWPRKTYVKAAKILHQEQQILPFHGALLYCEDTEKTVAAVPPRSGIDNILLRLKSDATKRNFNGHVALYSFEQVMSDEEIKRHWEENAEDSRNRGTEAHLQMELWFNSEPCRLDDPEVVVGLKFVRDCLLPIGAKPYRTEWEIYATDEDVAGSIDLAVVLPDQSIVLVDWKRAKKLPQKMRGYSNLPKPLNHLPDCAGVRYAMQLSLYHYILETYYGLRVVGRVLASIHPDVPFCTSVPYMKDEVAYLMAKRRARNVAKKKILSDMVYKHLVCCTSGLLCTEAMRDDCSNLYHTKIAKLNKVPSVHRDIQVERECEELITRFEEKVDLCGGTSWTSAMPKEGVADVLAFK